MRGLTDRVAMVIGGGSGIGRAAAIRLADEGVLVAVVDLDSTGAAATAADIEQRRGSGTGALAVTADATSEADVAVAVDLTVKRFGSLDIVVNCVARGSRKSMSDISLGEWQATITDCLDSYFIPVKAALPHLLAGQSTKIVNICSVNAHIGSGIPAYTAAKGAILAWSREMAMEFAQYGINVNSVSPGIIQTPINAGHLGEKGRYEHAVRSTPVGRLGQPDDVAAVVAFLASSDADFITGTDVMVDGGLSSGSAWGSAREGRTASSL